MKELYTIGEISAMYGINYRTLRYYDEVGLLKPEYINPDTNYRYYSTNQFYTLNNILYLRELDIPVQSIKEVLEKRDPYEMLKVFKARKNEVEDQINSLTSIKKKAENRISHLEDALSSKLGVIERKHFKDRRAAIRHTAYTTDDDIELPVQSLSGSDPKQFTVFIGKAALMISESDLLAGNCRIYSAVCVLLDDEDEYDGEIEILPESDALTLRFNGTHRDSPQYYETLLKYMDLNSLEIAGSSVEVTLVDYCLTDDESKYVTEIQLPVRGALFNPK